MGRPFANARHLVRLAGLFAAGIVVFLLLRLFFVPPGFGQYGHYRPGALDDNRNQVLIHAGRAACAECHDDKTAELAGGSHRGVGCEACHGALGAHAREEEGAAVPTPPDPATLCLVCHQVNAARPAGFPQVDPREHGDGESCSECHTPHSPAL